MSYITGTVTKHFMGWALSQDDFEFYLPWFMEDETRTTRDWVEAQKERYRASVSNPRTPRLYSGALTFPTTARLKRRLPGFRRSSAPSP